jgi:hypothetical protein
MPGRHTQVIKTSKELEALLEAEWGAQGKGLHEKVNWIQVSCRTCRCSMAQEWHKVHMYSMARVRRSHCRTDLCATYDIWPRYATD